MIEAIRRVKIAHGTCYAVAVGVAVLTGTLAAVSHVYIYIPITCQTEHQKVKVTTRSCYEQQPE